MLHCRYGSILIFARWPRPHLKQNLVDKRGRRLSPSYLRSLLALCDQHLEHAEPRVRSLVAATLGALTRAGDTDGSCATDGVEGTDCIGLAVYSFFRERLSGAISTNFERTKETITDAISGADNVAVDDTSGWKALETSLLALKVIDRQRTAPFSALVSFPCPHHGVLLGVVGLFYTTRRGFLLYSPRGCCSTCSYSK